MIHIGRISQSALSATPSPIIPNHMFKMKKQLYIAAALAIAAFTATAQQTNGSQGQQQELHKEITLEKDFVPVEKKAQKKNTLPTVKKAAAPARTDVSFSDWAKPIDVPTSIPTMMPYGYRTAHNFSDKRGYLGLGGGMAANFAASAGYRIIDATNLTLGAWLQHNSTWTAKNSTRLITIDDQRTKQEFNDNLIGLDLMSRLRHGTLTAGVRGHFDSFNYYGGNDQPVGTIAKPGSSFLPYDSTQTFLELGLRAAWQGLTLLADRELAYGASASFNHASYDKARPLSAFTRGAKENLLSLAVDGDYRLNDATHVGLELLGDYVNERRSPIVTPVGHTAMVSDSYFVTTITPYFAWQNTSARLRVGAQLLLGDLRLREFKENTEDRASGSRFHIAPDVQFDVNFTDGAAFYLEVGGGKTLNTLAELAVVNRYSDPNACHRFNTFSPFDAEAGFKIGPFAGFAARVFGGYGFFKGDLNTIIPLEQLATNPASDGTSTTILTPSAMRFSRYATFKFRGMKVGGELAYRYRSLIDAKASIIYAPAGDNISRNGWNKGYPLDGYDGAGLVAAFKLKVTPIRQLDIDLGLDWRGNRSVMLEWPADPAVVAPECVALNDYSWFDLNDAVDLHAGASWKFDRTLTLWARASNLLNRRWDVMPGMGAQKLNIMGGFSLVF